MPEHAPKLTERLRAELVAQARTGQTVTYRDLAARMGLQPPQTIRQLTDALEAMMAEDAARHAPFLAALCVSRLATGLPRQGFFDMATRLGRFSGPPDGPEARKFHQDELARLRAQHAAR